MKLNDDSGQFLRLPEMAPIFAGPAMAFVLSFLQSLYSDREPDKFKAIVGALICSFITVGVTTAVFFTVLILNIEIPVAPEYKMLTLTCASAGTGSFVGFLGVGQMNALIRHLLKKFLNIKLPNKQ